MSSLWFRTGLQNSWGLGNQLSEATERQLQDVPPLPSPPVDVRQVRILTVCGKNPDSVWRKRISSKWELVRSVMWASILRETEMIAMTSPRTIGKWWVIGTTLKEKHFTKLCELWEQYIWLSKLVWIHSNKLWKWIKSTFICGRNYV